MVVVVEEHIDDEEDVPEDTDDDELASLHDHTVVLCKFVLEAPAQPKTQHHQNEDRVN